METAEYTSGPGGSVAVAYNTRDLIIYALGIGSRDPRYIYENHSDFAAFPTYPIVLTFKGDSFDTLSFPSPAMMAFPIPPIPGVRVGLDAEKFIEKLHELPRTSENVQLRLEGGPAGIHQKGKGALLEKEFRIVDESGKVYYRMVDGVFLVGAKDFKDSGRSFSKTAPPPERAPDHSIDTATEQHIPSIYRLSGDYNPLHVDSQFAQMAGFKKPIMHGQCTMGHITRALLDALAGGDQKRFKSLQLRFASPVLPGETLLTEIWKKSPTHFIFQTKVKETGQVCASNGLLELMAEGKL